jgi:putative transposase
MRDLTASRPNERWVADFTYVTTWSGIVYVAFVVDVSSGAIVGWPAATGKRAKLVLDALDMALRRRDRAGTPAGQ